MQKSFIEKLSHLDGGIEQTCGTKVYQVWE